MKDLGILEWSGRLFSMTFKKIKLEGEKFY